MEVLHNEITRDAKLKWFSRALTLKEGTPYLSNARDGALVLQRLLALPLERKSGKRKAEIDRRSKARQRPVYGTSMLGKMVDPVSDTLERRDRSDGRVKTSKIHRDSDPKSTDISNTVGRPPGPEVGPLHPRDMDLRPPNPPPRERRHTERQRPSFLPVIQEPQWTDRQGKRSIRGSLSP
jgi:hypothetical protein